MDDLISRAAACECIGKMIHEYREKGEDDLADGMILARRYGIKYLPAVDAVPVVRCRDCKHYEVQDHWGNFGGVPVLAASDVPTCHKWSDGCVTEPNGYCFMGERRD